MKNKGEAHTEKAFQTSKGHMSVGPNAKDDESLSAVENDSAYGTDDDGLLDTCVRDGEVGSVAIRANSKGEALVGEEPAEAPLPIPIKTLAPP